MGWSCTKIWQMNNWQREQMPESGGEMEVRKIEIALSDCIKSDLHVKRGRRMGKIDRKKELKLLTENVVRER